LPYRLKKANKPNPYRPGLPYSTLPEHGKPGPIGQTIAYLKKKINKKKKKSQKKVIIPLYCARLSIMILYHD
jgi:hypothetical protein